MYVNEGIREAKRKMCAVNMGICRADIFINYMKSQIDSGICEKRLNICLDEVLMISEYYH